MQKPTILIVEDNQDDQLLLQHILEETYELVFTDKGKDAIELTFQKEPDLVLLDVNLSSGIDGYDVCKQIKQNPISKQTTIIFYSGDDPFISDEKIEESNADDFIPKSATPRHLKSVIRSNLILSKSRYIHSDLFSGNAFDELEARLKNTLPKDDYQSIDVAKILTELSIYQEELLAQNQELQDSHEQNIQLHNQFHLMFEALPVGVLLVGIKNGKIDSANPKAAEYLHLSTSHYVSKSLTSLLTNYFYLDVNDYIQWFTDDDENIYLDIQSVRNINHWYQLRKADFDKDYKLIIMTDISTEKQLHNSLEKSNKVKDEFLASISHETRTPLNIILGMTDLALKNDLPAKVIRQLENANKSAKTLLALIEKVLEYTEVAAKGKFAVQYRLFAMGDLTTLLVRHYQEKAEHQNIDFCVEVDQNLPGGAVSDINLILKALIELTDNAFKFTGKEGKISIIINKDNSRNIENDDLFINFLVKDTGIGISDEQMQCLFSLFTQLDSSSTRNYGGVGLGLIYSNNLVELLGGKIKVESELGKGSCFSFSIPSFKKPPL